MTSSSSPPHVLDCKPRIHCRHAYPGGLRCFNRVEVTGDLCLAHEERLPREPVALRDSRTGEPAEAT